MRWCLYGSNRVCRRLFFCVTKSTVFVRDSGEVDTLPSIMYSGFTLRFMLVNVALL